LPGGLPWHHPALPAQGGLHAEPRHIRTLHDCAEICQTAAAFMARSSDHHHAVCGLCATLCEACAANCERIGQDEEMNACARLCRRCAQSCREMAPVA
jgi:hypothetical protein